MGKNAFDDVLASIPEEGDRKAFEAVVAKYPTLKEGWLNRSDYSRRQDEMRDQLKFAQEMAAWQQENLVKDAFGSGTWATKREIELQKQLDKARPAAGKGEDMTAEELQAQLDAALAARGFVDKATFDNTVAGYQEQIKKQFEDMRTLVAQVGSIGGEAATVALRHEKEFGEGLNMQELYKFAHEKNVPSLETAYEQFVSGKRAEKDKAAWEAKVAEAEKAGYAKARQEIGMSPAGMPDDHTGAEMSALERRVNGAGAAGQVDLESLPFGPGSLARVAARTWQPEKQ